MDDVKILTAFISKLTDETKQVSAKVKEGLKGKVSKHNEKYGDSPTKRVTLRMLEAVFRRGVGAPRSRPGDAHRQAPAGHSMHKRLQYGEIQPTPRVSPGGSPCAYVVI